MKPIEVTAKNAVVRIYRRERKIAGVVYPEYRVADYSTGRRKFLSFADEKEARAKALDIAGKLGGKKGEVVTLDGAAASAYLRAMELIQSTGVPLELAAAEFVNARAILNGHSLTAAATFYMKRHKTTGST